LGIPLLRNDSKQFRSARVIAVLVQRLCLVQYLAIGCLTLRQQTGLTGFFSVSGSTSLPADWITFTEDQSIQKRGLRIDICNILTARDSVRIYGSRVSCCQRPAD